MKLWRLVRQPWLALDGAGPERHGARWTSPGRPVVNFASEPGLAVLVVQRYLPRDLIGVDEDYLLGWIETDEVPLAIPFTEDPLEKRQRGDAWLDAGQTLFAQVQSAVLPEAQVVMMNVAHPAAAKIGPLATRPFSFAQCLALPPLPD